MRIFSLITILVFGLTLTACGDDSEGEGAGSATQASSGEAHPLPGDPEAGEAVYQRACLACHAADGRGNGGMTGADFVGDATRLAKSNEELLTSIRDGKQTGSLVMPPQGALLSEQEMKDALAYVRQQWGAQ